MKKHIPNMITSMNLVCGIIGVVFAFKGRMEIAFPLMLLAGVFDFCDGLAARVLHAYSDMGKELDSLCDLVSFGVLPSMMLYNTMKVCSFSETALCYIPLLIAVFSALRLAKFNVDERQTCGFIGLPSPASAMICGSLCYYIAYNPACFFAEWAAGYVFIPVLTAVLCFLLVCEIPMFSMKFKKDDTSALKSKRIAFGIAALVCAAFAVIFSFNWSLVLLLVFTVYVLMNLTFAIFKV